MNLPYTQILLGALLASSIAVVADENTELTQDFNIYNQRYVDRLCPPEYQSTQELITGFMAVDHMIGKFRSVFGSAAPGSMNEIAVLDDLEDADACEFLALAYDQMINRKVRIVDGAEARYLFDVTFYKGGEFYFVVTGRGYLFEDKSTSMDGYRRHYHDGYPGVTPFFQDDLTPVPWMQMWEMMQEDQALMHEGKAQPH